MIAVVYIIGLIQVCSLQNVNPISCEPHQEPNPAFTECLRKSIIISSVVHGLFLSTVLLVYNNYVCIMCLYFVHVHVARTPNVNVSGSNEVLFGQEVALTCQTDDLYRVDWMFEDGTRGIIIISV